jgi:hypothetical protein
MSLFRSLFALLIALHLASPAVAQQPAPTPGASSERNRPARQARPRTDGRSSGFISGKILVDGQPLGGVRIAINSAGSSSTLLENLMGKGNDELTEDDGKFTFEGLQSAAYTLRPMLTGYIVESGVLDSDGQQIYYRPGDFANIKMVKGGVITGRVSGESGSPLVGVSVRAVRLRDLQGRNSAGLIAEALEAFQPMTTDDRGIYRIYGLLPGVYAVCAGASLSPDSTGPFDNDSAVYHPGGPLADAVEVAVRAGQEATGIDISYRELSGHSISGNLGGRIPSGALVSGAAVVLTDANTGSLQGLRLGLGVGGDASGRAFSFSGVPDAKYEVTAVGGLAGSEITVAPPRTVTVQGSDVTGVDLVLGPLAEVSGRVILDTTPQTEPNRLCSAKPAAAIERSVISIRKAGEQLRQFSLGAFFTRGNEAVPDGKGEFRVRLISSGVHFIKTDLPGDDLYLRSMTLPELADGRPAGNPAEGLDVKIGEKLSGVTITLARGAASFAGRVVPGDSDSKRANTADPNVPASDTALKATLPRPPANPDKTEVNPQGTRTPEKSPASRPSKPDTGDKSPGIVPGAATLPERLQVIMVPVEPEASTDPLRYAGSSVQPDGSFTFKNLAPGRYYLLTRTIPDDQWNNPDRLPDWCSPEHRKMLHRDAKKGGLTIELNQCAAVKDYSLRYSAAPPLTPAR